MNYWLVKTEPEVYSIEDLKRDRRTAWDLVRNYQARNYLRAMQKGDRVLIYHSNAEPSGVAGIASVAKVAYPDPSQFDRRSEYFDPKATPDAPRWFCPELKFERVLPRLVPLAELREVPTLRDMELLRRGSRLSVQPVTEAQFETILRCALQPAAGVAKRSARR